MLTKTDIQALRRASAICFFLQDGKSKVVCVKEPSWQEREQNPYADTKRYEINADHIVSAYKDMADIDRDKLYGFEMIQCPSLLQWRTIIKLLRQDDVIKLHWIANNNNGFLDQVQYANDNLHLIVVRKNKEIYDFFVDVCVCPSGSSARMIRLQPT